MKRMLLRLLAVVLTMCTLFSLAACNDNPSEKDTTEKTTQAEAPTESKAEEQTTAAAPQGLVIVEDGSTDYTVIYSRTDGEYARFAAEMVAKKIREATGTHIVVSVDTSPKGEKEIILGATAREETLSFDRETHNWSTPLYVGMYEDSVLITAKEPYQTFDNLNLVIDLWLASYEERGKLLFGEDTCNMMMHPPVDCTMDTLTVLSQNLYGFQGSGENTGEKRIERVLAQLKFYSPDIFSVNEQSAGWVPIFEENAPEYERFDSGSVYAGLGRNNSIYYKKDKIVVEDGGYQLNGRAGDAEGTQYDRIIIWAMLRIKTTGQRFFYVSTHLDTKSDYVRTMEANRVLALIKEKAGDDVPVFLAGDMNASMDSGCYKVLTEYFDDVRLSSDINLSGSNPTFTAMNPDFAGSIIDYHFVKKNAGVQSCYFKVVDERSFGDYSFPLGSYTSDHYAVFSKHKLG